MGYCRTMPSLFLLQVVVLLCLQARLSTGQDPQQMNVTAADDRTSTFVMPADSTTPTNSSSTTSSTTSTSISTSATTTPTTASTTPTTSTTITTTTTTPLTPSRTPTTTPLGVPSDAATTRIVITTTTADPSVSYRKPAVARIIGPLFGPLAGGTQLTLIGQSLTLTPGRTKRSTQFATIDNIDIGYLPAVIDRVNSKPGSIVLKTPTFTENGSFAINLQLSNGFPDYHIGDFVYRDNPVVADLQPRTNLIVGGTVVYLNGTNMDAVDSPRLSLTVVTTRLTDDGSVVTDTTITDEECDVVDKHLMACLMPEIKFSGYFVSLLTNHSAPISNSSGSGIAAYFGPNGVDRVDIYAGLVLDGYTQYQNMSVAMPGLKLEFFQSPVMKCSSGVKFNSETMSSVTIEGSMLTRASRLLDVTVQVGDGVCEVIELTAGKIVCNAPVQRPNRGNSTACDGDSYPLKVTIGNAVYECGCLLYWTYGTRAGIIAGLIVAIITPIIAAIIIALLIYHKPHLRHRWIGDLKPYRRTIDDDVFEAGDQQRETDIDDRITPSASAAEFPGIRRNNTGTDNDGYSEL